MENPKIMVYTLKSQRGAKKKEFIDTRLFKYIDMFNNSCICNQFLAHC